MDIREFLKDNFLVLDGGMGTLLQKRGLSVSDLPERWNLTHPEVIREIHLDYFNAGSNVVNTNTFGANLLKFSPEELDSVVRAALDNAKWARDNCRDSKMKWIALDIGPLGRMLKPYGDMEFERATEIFSSVVTLGVKYGADLIMIETMSDSYETKAAVLAAKENSTLPVFVCNAYGEDGKLMTGADPLAMITLLEGLAVDAIGVNCSLGPRALSSVVKEYLKYSSLPVILKPNAGLPKMVGGETVFDLTAGEFCEEVFASVRGGVRVFGGCCGTTPEYIAALCERVTGTVPLPIEKKEYVAVSSYTHGVIFGADPVLIGERINPTGKKRFKEALRSRDIDYILKEGISEEEMGAHVLDVNVGLPEIDEKEMLTRTVCELQAVVDLPLQIDTSDPEAMESALRVYNGKAMINSVNGKRESMERVFPLAKKYGGVVVALTLDERGIPEKAEGRVEIARKILAYAEEQGIEKKNIIFDPLALTVSADRLAAVETLRAVKMITEELGCPTSLGVSNVSFGLPARDGINASFFTQALSAGLGAAIMNPHSHEMMRAYYSFRALSGLDENMQDYVAFCERYGSPTVQSSAVQSEVGASENFGSELERAVVKGLREEAAGVTRKMLVSLPPLSIVQEHIIPALDKVGVAYENKKVYLPGLLMSAEAAASAFEVIKEGLPKGASDKCTVVIATVKGDIHDIGKNIVKLVLENYGFRVIDLGKDVSPEKIVDTAVAEHSAIVGLSALMTTTVVSMEETVRLLRHRLPECKIMVGGAVLNEEYAKKMGADKYAKDAMEAVRYAEEVNSSQKR